MRKAPNGTLHGHSSDQRINPMVDHDMYMSSVMDLFACLWLVLPSRRDSTTTKKRGTATRSTPARVGPQGLSPFVLRVCTLTCFIGKPRLDHALGAKAFAWPAVLDEPRCVPYTLLMSESSCQVLCHRHHNGVTSRLCLILVNLRSLEVLRHS